MSSVDVLRPLEKGYAIKSNNRIVLESKLEPLFKINAVANIKVTLHEKVSQVTFFQLMVQNGLSWDIDRFKIL